MRAHRQPCIPPPIPKNDEPIIALTDYCLYGPGQLGQQGKKSSSSPHPPSPFVNKSVNYTHSGAPLLPSPSCLQLATAAHRLARLASNRFSLCVLFW